MARASGTNGQQKPVLDPRVSNGIAIVITLVWAISYLVDMAMNTYDPPASVNAIMMIVAGAFAANGVMGNSK